jgi:hypothetical protein
MISTPATRALSVLTVSAVTSRRRKRAQSSRSAKRKPYLTSASSLVRSSSSWKSATVPITRVMRPKSSLPRMRAATTVPTMPKAVEP